MSVSLLLHCAAARLDYVWSDKVPMILRVRFFVISPVAWYGLSVGFNFLFGFPSMVLFFHTCEYYLCSLPCLRMELFSNIDLNILDMYSLLPVQVLIPSHQPKDIIYGVGIRD